MKQKFLPNQRAYWWLVFSSHVLIAFIVLTSVAYVSNRLFQKQGLWIFIISSIILSLVIMFDFVRTYQIIKKLR